MSVYRTASLQDVAVLLDWAAEEGWNPGLDDAQAFHAADPSGFFVATEQDAPVAGISVVNHSETFAFLGLYIVRPAWRGRGIGHRLWQHALTHAGARTVGLDGVPEQQQNYVASGFAHAGGTTRYSGTIPARACDELRRARLDEIPELVALEAKCSGQRKPAYLTRWFQPSATRRTLVLQRDQAISGFCTVRACREGAKVGPLYAKDTVAAKTMLEHAATLWDGPIVIDVPANSSDLARLCHGLGLFPGFETARMYRGPYADAGPEIFAAATLELG